MKFLKIHIAKWTKSEVEAFERGMRTHHKEFALIKKHEMSKSNKSIGEILQYYYVWKKLPRYNMWQNRKRYTVNSTQNIYSTQSAPIKHDEPNRNSADPRLRNRPRIDYSQSSNGSHFWGPNPVPAPVQPQNGERKRKRRDETEEFGEPTNLGVFDVSVYAGIDYEKLRQIKRSRLGVDILLDEHNEVDDFLLPLSSSSSDEGFWENDAVDDIPSTSVTSLFEDPVPSSFPDVQNYTNNNPSDNKEDEESQNSKQQILEYTSLAPDSWENEETPYGTNNKENESINAFINTTYSSTNVFRFPSVTNGSDAQNFSSASVDDDDSTKRLLKETQSQPEIQPESYFT